MTPVRRRRRGGRIEEEHQPLRPPTHETEPSDLTPTPHSTSGPDAILDLQQRYGNAYVNRRMAERGTIQRGPTPRVKEQPRTHKWEYEEHHKGRASLHRTTKIESDRWGEIGPTQPRIKYRREVNLRTADGAEVYVDIRGIARLQPGTTLPDTPEAALDISGLAVETQLSFVVEGGDFETFRDYQRREVRALSLSKVAEAVLPDYAKLPLNPAQQEAAILRYLSGLKKRKKEPPKAKDDDGSVAGHVIDTATDFVPFVGELKDAYRAIMGVDPYTGRKLALWERILSGIFAIPILGKGIKWIGKGLKWIGKGLGWVGRKLGKWLGPYGVRALEWIIEKLAPKRTKHLPPGGTQTGKQIAQKTGTVWDKITPVGPIRPNTAIPQFFELETKGGKYFVNTNGTKHMEELVVGSKHTKTIPDPTKPGKTIDVPSNTADKVTHSVQMRSQAVLDSFAEAVEQAERQGIKWGQIMNVGPWELIFEQVGKSGPLPVIKHAVYGK